MDQEELCKGEPFVDLYYTKFPAGMDACMHHCENLGTRVPSVSNLQDWTKLQIYLKTNLYEIMRLWLPITNRKTEGEWIDFYTGSVLENFSHPWVGSGSESSLNCAYLLDENTWDKDPCEHPHYACMCTRKPNSYLEFKGLCKASAIDIYYKGGVTGPESPKIQALPKLG